MRQFVSTQQHEFDSNSVFFRNVEEYKPRSAKLYPCKWSSWLDLTDEQIYQKVYDLGNTRNEECVAVPAILSIVTLPQMIPVTQYTIALRSLAWNKSVQHALQRLGAKHKCCLTRDEWAEFCIAIRDMLVYNSI
jgi:hypothetical protein